MTNEPNNFNFSAIIAPEAIISDIEALRVFFNPLRQDIMRAMAQQPRTVQSIAEELGIPFTRLYYHVNQLEKHQLIQLVGIRTLSGAVEEKYYQITAHTYRVDQRLLTMGLFDGQHDTMEALDMVCDETRLNIRYGLLQGVIVDGPVPYSLLLDRRITHLSNEQATLFYDIVHALLDEFDASNQDGSAPYVLTVALHPQG